ncbi:hypothetical protein ACLK2A_14885 [Escherichia coli]
MNIARLEEGRPMQLIEYLRERQAFHISLTPPNALCGLWKCVAVIPTLSLKLARPVTAGKR